MAFSMDDRFLFTAGEDGSLYFFRIQDKESRGLQTSKRDVEYADEIVITKTELQEKVKKEIGTFFFRKVI